jgi:hypothetical protein
LGGIVKMPDGRDLEVKLEQEETVPSWDDEDQRVDADFRSVAGKMQLPKLVRYAVEAGEERKVGWNGRTSTACLPGRESIAGCYPKVPTKFRSAMASLYDDEPFKNATVA